MSTIWGTPWEQCYRYFGLPTKAFDSEIACLRLAFFLAHFGMFRASGSLRSLHHADYKNIVSICRKFTDLRVGFEIHENRANLRIMIMAAAA